MQVFALLEGFKSLATLELHCTLLLKGCIYLPVKTIEVKAKPVQNDNNCSPRY